MRKIFFVMIKLPFAMRKILFVVLILLSALAARGQVAMPNKPYMALDHRKGFLTINEFTFGVGWADEDVPYSQGYLGFTTLLAYQENERLMVGLATGLLYYNDGFLVPVYADGRVSIKIDILVPYLSFAGGILFNPSSFGPATHLFMNPSFGMMAPLSRNTALNISGGYLVQIAPRRGTSQFINIKAGMTYKFKGRSSGR
ncbi:MAG: hypothetical protein RQ743_13945 [Bacteroidales bacterium]|nr:hypothetical protein [Bacteroidales bacterium]